MIRAYSYPLFTQAEIEARERLIQERTGIIGIDPAWLRIEAVRELRLGLPADPVRETACVDEEWSVAQHCRRAS